MNPIPDYTHSNKKIIAFALALTALLLIIGTYFLVDDNLAKNNSDSDVKGIHTIESNKKYKVDAYDDYLQNIEIPNTYTTDNFSTNFNFNFTNAPIIEKVEYKEFVGPNYEEIVVPGLQVIYDDNFTLNFIETSDVSRSIAAAGSGIQAQDKLPTISVLGQEKNFVVNLSGEGVPNPTQTDASGKVCVDIYRNETYIVHITEKLHAFIQFDTSSNCDTGEIDKAFNDFYSDPRTTELLNIISSINL